MRTVNYVYCHCGNREIWNGNPRNCNLLYPMFPFPVYSFNSEYNTNKWNHYRFFLFYILQDRQLYWLRSQAMVFHEIIVKSVLLNTCPFQIADCKAPSAMNLTSSPKLLINLVENPDRPGDSCSSQLRIGLT